MVSVLATDMAWMTCRRWDGPEEFSPVLLLQKHSVITVPFCTALILFTSGQKHAAN
jgi:hypothetical protein